MAVYGKWARKLYATLTVGKDDLGHDVKFYGATSGKYLLWDESADSLLLVGTLAPGSSDGAALGSTSLMWSDLFLASGAVINFNNGGLTITHSATDDRLALAATWTTVAATGRPFLVQLTTAVRLGSYANAFKAYIDCSTAGGSQGVLSSANFEINMPSTSGGEGVYTCTEHEMVMPDGFNASGCIPSFSYYNTAGTAKAAMDTSGDFFHIDSGLTAATDKLIGENSSTLRIGLGANATTKRYIPLSTAGDSFTTVYPIVSTYAGGTAISSTFSTGTTGYYGMRTVATFTLATTGVHKAISGEVTYSPTTSGYATPIGVVGKVSLGSNFTGGTGYMWGVQGQLDLGTSRTINNASSVFAGVRGVITGTTPTFTDADEICCVYADNLCTTNMAGMSTGNSSLFRGHCTGGTMDNAIHIWASNNITNLFNLEACGGMVSAGAATHSGTIKKVACLLDEVTYYLTISTAVS